MTFFLKSFQAGRRWATVAGLHGVALASVLLLCGAGRVPVENFTPQGPMQADLNAGGHSVTNAATVSAVNVTGGGAQLTGLHGYTSESVSAAGTATLSSLGRVSEDTITLNAGTAAYTVNRSLADAGAQAGDLWEINVAYPASTHPTLNIYDNSTSGTLLIGSAGTANAGTTTLQFAFNGTNWVHYAKGALLTRNLGTGVPAATALAANANGGLPTMAANNQTPLSLGIVPSASGIPTRFPCAISITRWGLLFRARRARDNS